MLAYFKEAIEDVIIRWVSTTVNVENVRRILRIMLQRVKAKAEDTENVLDDWCIEALENIIESEEKVQIICDFLKSMIPEGVCCAPDMDHEFRSLADVLLVSEGQVCEGGHCCSAPTGNPALLAEILKLVLPVIIKFFKEGE